MSNKDDNLIRIDFQAAAEEQESQAGIDADVHEAVSIGGEEPQQAFERLLEAGMVMVTLDTRVEGVQVPASFQGLLQLHLNFSHRFHIEDFVFDEKGVRASLDFNEGPFFCDVPWSAVYLLSSEPLGERVLFPDRLPTELLQVLSAIDGDGIEGEGDGPED